MDFAIAVLENLAVIAIALAAISGVLAQVARLFGFRWLAKAAPVLATVADELAGNAGRAKNAAAVLADVHAGRTTLADAIRAHAPELVGAGPPLTPDVRVVINASAKVAEAKIMDNFKRRGGRP